MTVSATVRARNRITRLDEPSGKYDFLMKFDVLASIDTEPECVNGVFFNFIHTHPTTRTLQCVRSRDDR
jgi:hypothetical protein